MSNSHLYYLTIIKFTLTYENREKRKKSGYVSPFSYNPTLTFNFHTKSNYSQVLRVLQVHQDTHNNYK
jgi:P pilus assembly chaperone PapD